MDLSVFRMREDYLYPSQDKYTGNLPELQCKHEAKGQQKER
jgi:hypothetical protein